MALTLNQMWQLKLAQAAAATPRDLGEIDVPSVAIDPTSSIPSDPGQHHGPAPESKDDTGPLYNYNPPPDAPVVKPAPAYTNRWNAPGFEHTYQAPTPLSGEPKPKQTGSDVATEGLDAADLVAGDREHRDMNAAQVRRGLTPEKAREENAAAAAKLGNKYDKGDKGTEGGKDGAPAPSMNWAGAAGGTATIAAHEQKAVSQTRQDAKGAAIDAEGAAVGKQQDAATATADANADVERQRAIGTRDVAKANEDAGVDIKLRAQAAKDESAAYRKHIDDFSAKLASDKIDHSRLWNDQSMGGKIAWTLAKGLGAVGQAFMHTSTNQVADSIDAMVAGDVADQRAKHEMGREHLGDMKTAYAQALQATGDREQAERVATGYGLEAAKQNAQALLDNAHGAVQKAKGGELVAELEGRKAALGERKVDAGIAMNPYVQAQTVKTGLSMKEIGKLARDRVTEQERLGYGEKEGNTLDAAFRWVIKSETGRDPTPSAGRMQGGGKDGALGPIGGMTREQAGKIAQETQETQTATDEFNRQMANMRTHPVITGSGLTDAALSSLPQRVAPGSNDAQQQLEAINTRNLQAIGKVAKDADGKPNKAMIEKIEKRFELHLGDAPEMKLQKLQGITDVYNALARQQGARAPEPGAPAKPVDPSFKKE